MSDLIEEREKFYVRKQVDAWKLILEFMKGREDTVAKNIMEHFNWKRDFVYCRIDELVQKNLIEVIGERDVEGYHYSLTQYGLDNLSYWEMMNE